MKKFSPDVTLAEGFTARTASIADLDALVHVEQLSQGAPWTREVFAKEFDLDVSRAWVVEWHEPDAPCALAAYLVFWLVHDEVHILNVVVHPDARRKGLAASLLRKLVADAKTAECALLSLEVRVGNAPAQGLYRSLGFVPIGRRSNYYADNHEDADVLALVLDT